jgi:hypothetical protein
MARFQTLGFNTEYSVEEDPEFPSDGVWDHRQVRVENPNSSLVGGPQALIRPTTGEPWYLVASLAQFGELYATPDPYRVCLFEQYERAVLIDTRSPEIQEELSVYPVRIVSAVEHGILLVCSWTDLTAVGIEGIRWRSVRLVADDLHVERVRGDRIECRGYAIGSAAPARLTLDARTGEVIAGVAYSD